MGLKRLLAWVVLGGMAGLLAVCGGGLAADPSPTSFLSMAMSSASLQFGSVTVGTSGAAQWVTVSNTGAGTITVSAIDVDNSAFTISASSLPISLAPSTSTQIRITFKPSDAGVVSGWLSVRSNGPYSPYRIALSGTGTTAPREVSVGPPSLSFGSQTTGTTSLAQTSTVTNTGTVNLTGSPVTSDNSVYVTSPGRPVRFGPIIASPAVSTPQITIGPSSLSFGNQTVGTASSRQMITVTNDGTANATISSIASNNSAFAVTAPAMPATLAPSQSLEASVSFDPSSAGATSGAISIISNAPSSPGSVAVSGTGIYPYLSLGPSSLSFGNQAVGTTSAAQVVTVTNAGTVNATITSITSDNSAFTMTAPALPLTLAPAQSFQLSVTFVPASAGAVSAWVSVYSNAQYSPNGVEVTGTGTTATPQITVGPSSLSFGNQTVGTASSGQMITVTNNGTVNATISSIASNNSVFAVTAPAMPATLAPSQSLEASVSFDPSSAGAASGAIAVSSTASSSPNSVAVSGAGMAATATLSLSASSLAFSNDTIGVTSAVQTVTLTNTGNTSVSVTGLSITPSQFLLVAEPTLPLSLTAGQSTTLSIAFDPTSASTVTGQLTLTSTASPATNTVSLSGSGVQATTLSGLTLLTSSLHTGYLQQSYSAVLTASGGKTPYTWSVSSGQLPPGLTLNAGTGQITGTPTQDGQFSVGAQATDSTTPAALGIQATLNLTIASGVYDQYGGITELACSNGPAPHFYTQKINGRWWLCTPAGNAFWMRGVYDVDASDTEADYQGVFEYGTACTSASPASVSDPCSVVEQKYGDASVTWGPQTVQRLKAWGFNTTAEYSSLYVQPTATNPAWTSTSDESNPQKMPFTGLVWPSHYSRNSNSYAGPVKDLVGPTLSSVYNGDRNASPDVFDPNFAAWLAGDLADYTNAEYNWIHSSHSDYLIGINVDDTDELVGFGAGADFEGLSNGEEVTGLAHPNLAWIVLITPPTQSSGTDANGNPITYTNTTVYSKQAFANFMSSRYNGSITALNTAWGSSYTTFGDAGGWGTGTGLLDENGTHAWVPTDAYMLTGATAAMQADLNAYLLYHAQYYFSVIQSALQTAAPGILYLGPTNLGGWGAPPRAQILQAAAQYVNVIPISSIPTGCLSCTDDQAKIDFIYQNGGDKPWINWEGYLAQPDSYMSIYSPTQTSYPQSESQPARGELFQTMISQNLSAADSTTGSNHIVGYKWWQFYDDRGEASNWGLATRRDNGYDGVSSVTGGGVDSWGFATGGEQGNYGDFLDAVTSANLNVYKSLLGLP